MTSARSSVMEHDLPEDPALARVLDRQARRTRWVLLALVLALVVVFVLSVGLGALALSPGTVLGLLGQGVGLPVATPASPVEATVFWALRLPRACLAVLVGGSLALSGALLQGLFRNPLADPGLIGVSTGAALAAALVIGLGSALPVGLVAALGIGQAVTLPLAAFAGGLGITALVHRLATRDGITDVPTLLLAGIALNAVAGAVIGLMVYVSDDQALRDLNFWMLGSLGGVTWDRLALVAPILGGTALLALPLASALNALLLGETEAVHLGLDVEQAKRRIIVLGALGVGASVAVTGVIGFVGLVVPHLARLLLGPDHRGVLPASVLLGAVLLLLADLLARTVVLPAELPIGILTSLRGGAVLSRLVATSPGPLMTRRALGEPPHAAS
ncbi:FecCD family ABC transporter permease [Pararhodospirillum photometricum]|uniref:Hemin transport system permease protein HmuU1,putative n=1 Tax=Pararhodospirillum photometricum DSM 122 TaxID=1150469 RepID=H6SMU5_PARPM|nr:iron ABC transporter permease [Pararhodospirillum photometricum]CCG09230.1 Hemin transport system permease protein HmuU1,putative [Pararhodospirillum photometricum DSM 122]